MGGDLFGEARSMAQRRASLSLWRQLCDIIEQIDEGPFWEEWAPYLNHHMASWPDGLRPAPRAWVDRAIKGDPQANAWLSVTRAISISKPRPLSTEIFELWLERGYWSNWSRVSLNGQCLRPQWLKQMWSKTELTHLRARKVKLRTWLVEALQECCSNTLEELELCDEYLGDELAADLMAIDAPLHSLILQNNELTDEFIMHALDIGAFESLACLDLGDNPVPSALTLLASGECPMLEEVYLSSTGAYDEVIDGDHDQWRQSWRVLDYSHNELTAQGLEMMGEMGALQSLAVLDLSHTDLGVDGLAHLPLMPWARSLKDVSLSECGWDDGAALLFAQHANAFEQLERLVIDLHELSPGVQELLETHPHLQRALRL